MQENVKPAPYDHCVFCGKALTKNECHDIRPIVTDKGTRCCSKCNDEIVGKTRMTVWIRDNELLEFKELLSRNCIKDIHELETIIHMFDKTREIINDYTVIHWAWTTVLKFFREAPDAKRTNEEIVSTMQDYLSDEVLDGLFLSDKK